MKNKRSPGILEILSKSSFNSVIIYKNSNILMVFLILVLVMLLAFILLGMNALTNGGIFNSVINSIIPMLTGFGVNRNANSGYSKDALIKKKDGVLAIVRRITEK